MSETASWLIGSLEDCDLTVPDSTVSGRHCRLTRDATGYRLEDLDSTNGTYVNGTRITGPATVSKSDTITLGKTVSMPWPLEENDDGTPQQIIRVGRDPDNQIVIDEPTVSSFHAEIVVSDGRYLVKDLDSTNGTAVGAADQLVQMAEFRPNDVLFFGDHRMAASQLIGQVASPIKIASPHPEKRKSEIAFSGQFMTFGRAPECDQILDFPMISWEHARMTRTGSSITVEDLGSTNGTFVNGVPIQQSTRVNPGDTVALGSFSFILTADGMLKKRDFRGDLTLQARNIAIDVPGLRLLENISLTINPSEFTGLMGPSGAGKTTLMKAMNGYTQPSNGQVFLNGRDLYREFNQFRGQIGYVPQDDIIHSDLTVKQALYFTARLRLPPDFRDNEINKLIDKVLTDLGIQHTQDVLIGSPERKGISGGQRKRVNLAMELLTDPSLLFLDEPTSGLSSEDALSVMKVLRGLADAGKTILLTIHQPSLEVFQQLDNLVVVSKDQGSKDPGQLVYYGPAYPCSVDHFNPEGVSGQQAGMLASPDEVLRGLSRQKTSFWVKRYSSSSYRKEFVTQRAKTSLGQPEPSEGKARNEQRQSSQWFPLVQRCLSIKWKDTANTAVLLAQAPVIAILIAMVFGEASSKTMSQKDWPEVASASSTTVFLLSLAALWFGCSNSIREIVAEWAIYHRERMVNLRIAPYIFSKFAVLGGLCLLQCLILLTIVHWGNGLDGPWLGMLIVLVLVSLVGLSIGLMVSALVRTSEVAIAILPLILLPMVILGGVLQPLEKMSAPMRLSANMMPSRWAFESMLLMESNERPSYSPPALPGVEPSSERDVAEQFFPENETRTSVSTGVFVLMTMLVITVLANTAILRRRDVHQA